MSPFVSEWVRERPKRLYKNFTDFCTKRSWLGRKLEAGDYPCLECSGRRWQFAPGSQSDPVEGNKFRESVPCEACAGTGQSSRKACLKAYRQDVARWKAEVQRYDRLAKAKAAALKKLTDEEVEALKALGL
jgi:hypothetical protein